jgi:hypothetical protein
VINPEGPGPECLEVEAEVAGTAMQGRPGLVRRGGDEGESKQGHKDEDFQELNTVATP